MALDWDELVLGPAMAIFGEGRADDPASWPTFYPATGPAFQLPGAVFDAEYRDTTVVGDTPATTLRPVLGVRASLFSMAPAQADGVFIPSIGATFAVADARPDGHGHVLLILMETDA